MDSMNLLLRYLLIIISVLGLANCEQTALLMTPSKKPVNSNTALANAAEKNFWVTLHQGNYNAIPQTIDLLTAAYLQNPNDPSLAAHLGFMHIWKITERAREKNIPPTIIDEITLAKKYFSDAVLLNPTDARLQGFLGVSLLASGKIFQDEREQVHGYFTLKHAIALWPEFNYFTAGYPMSDLDPSSKYFKEGLEWQWKTLDVCSGTVIDKNNPNFSPYLSRETHQGPQRACWNSWIAPHNFEGFFLNMGDMLVKQGDWQTGIKIYQNAKLSKNYAAWPYRGMLENRIKNAKKNVIYFREKTSHTAVLFNSGRGCVVCHQGSV